MDRLSFYWWERVSAKGLRDTRDLARWPFPPKVYDVCWIGAR